MGGAEPPQGSALLARGMSFRALRAEPLDILQSLPPNREGNVVYLGHRKSDLVGSNHERWVSESLTNGGCLSL